MYQRGRPADNERIRLIFQSLSTQSQEPPAPAQTPPEQPTTTPDAQEAEAPEQGLYIISVAARILHMHPQTLRKYERVGLVRPSRTAGMLRLYSERDIAKLRMIKHLVDEMRLNLAGVELALSVFERLISVMEATEKPTAAQIKSFEDATQDILDLFFGRTDPRTTPPSEQ